MHTPSALHQIKHFGGHWRSASTLSQVAGELLSQLAEEGAGHWLDEGTEHPHRIALSIRADRIPPILEQLKTGFAQQGVQVGLVP